MRVCVCVSRVHIILLRNKLVILMPGILQISSLLATSPRGEEFTRNKARQRVTETSRATKLVNLQCSGIYRARGWERREGAAGRAAAQPGALRKRAPDGWEEEGKVETNLTSENDLLADENERQQQNAPARDGGGAEELCRRSKRQLW